MIMHVDIAAVVAGRRARDTCRSGGVSRPRLAPRCFGRSGPVCACGGHVDEAVLGEVRGDDARAVRHKGRLPVVMTSAQSGGHPLEIT